MTIVDIFVLALIGVGLAFIIHYKGLGSDKMQTAAKWVVGGVMAALASLTDAVQPLLAALGL